MDAEFRKLLIDIHGEVKGIKPILESHTVQLGAMDKRTRDVEVGQATHSIEIKRAQSDLDGLGRKVRYQAPTKEGEGVKVFKLIEFLIELPKYWHVILSIGSFATAVIMLAWKMRGGAH